LHSGHREPAISAIRPVQADKPDDVGHYRIPALLAALPSMIFRYACIRLYLNFQRENSVKITDLFAPQNDKNF
jgi:hypothetical protein